VKYHQTVKRVTESLEELRYNTAIAALMAFVNTLRAESCTLREGAGADARAVRAALCGGDWERLGHGTSVFDARWLRWGEGGDGAGEWEDAVKGDGGAPLWS
jgi:leucyl-tRNA synthetase